MSVKLKLILEDDAGEEIFDNSLLLDDDALDNMNEMDLDDTIGRAIDNWIPDVVEAIVNGER